MNASHRPDAASRLRQLAEESQGGGYTSWVDQYGKEVVGLDTHQCLVDDHAEMGRLVLGLLEEEREPDKTTTRRCPWCSVNLGQRHEEWCPCSASSRRFIRGQYRVSEEAGRLAADRIREAAETISGAGRTVGLFGGRCA